MGRRIINSVMMMGSSFHNLHLILINSSIHGMLSLEFPHRFVLQHYETLEMPLDLSGGDAPCNDLHAPFATS